MESVYDPDKRKLLSAVCHGMIFLNISLVVIGVPIALMLLSDDPVVKENAKESVNMHLNLWVINVVGGSIMFVLNALLVGILLWPIVIPLGIILNFVLPGWAVFKCLVEPDEVHRYPFIFRPL